MFASRFGATALLTAVLAVPCAASTDEGGGSVRPSGAGGQSDRLRGMDPGARALLAAGAARSPTFSAIAATLERSDLIVYVETRALKLRGQLQFVRATPAARYVRIAVNVPGREDELIAWLAHELWHAVEIAQARDVTSDAGVSLLYGRIGQFDRSTREAETEQAQAVGARVLDELQARRGEPAPLPGGWQDPFERRLLAELQPKAIARRRPAY